MDDEQTTYRVKLADEAVEALLEQAVASRMPPRELLSTIATAALLQAKAAGYVLVPPSEAVPSITKH